MATENNLYFQFQSLLLESLIDRDMTYAQREGTATYYNHLDAYNRYQEDERDGVDYIFNIGIQNDSADCIKGGMSIDELFFLEQECRQKHTPYYMFGHCHEKADVITPIGVCNAIKAVSDELAKCVLLYKDKVKEYEVLYKQYEDELNCHKSYTWACYGSDGAKSFRSGMVFPSLSDCQDNIMNDIHGKISYYLKFNELGFNSDREVYETHIENYMNGVVLKTYGGTYEYRVIEFDDYKTMLIDRVKNLIQKYSPDKCKTQCPFLNYNFHVGGSYAIKVPLNLYNKTKTDAILHVLATDGRDVFVYVKKDIDSKELMKHLSLFDTDDIETILIEFCRVIGIPAELGRKAS